MKKQLFDLTIEEFTRVLLDYPEKIELQFNGYDENGKTEEPDTLIGTYEELNNFAKSYNPNHVCRILIQSTLSHHLIMKYNLIGLIFIIILNTLHLIFTMSEYK